MAKNWNWWSRKLHRWGAFITAVPMILVIATGLLLQVKKQVPWVQPPTQKGTQKNVMPSQDWESLMQSARSVDEAQIQDWNDIDRLDVRPSKGIVKVQAKNHWEIQVDLSSGEVLSATYRRSDLIESLHDGSFFADWAKLWIFLPNGLILLGLWLTGLWLWYLPRTRRRGREQRSTSKL
ncbi:MAG: PepSY domain-containing protein [Planctomycetota bacterium]